MKNKQAIQTKDAPTPVGVYSQAIKVARSVYLSGQIPLEDPKREVLVKGNIERQAKQTLKI